MLTRRAAWMLVCLVLIATSAAAAEPGTPPTCAELLSWRDTLWRQMREAPVENEPAETNDPGGADTWLYAFSFGMATLTSPALGGEENPVAEVELLTDAVAGPRGVRAGDTLETVLAAYPNENPALTGDAGYATLYLSQGEEGAGWGWLIRRNRTVDAVQYVATAPAPGLEGFVQSLSVLYIIEDGLVSSIRVDGFEGLVAEADALADYAAVRGIAARREYTPEAIGEVRPFAPEDLAFSGIDLRTAAPEDVAGAFGEPLEDASGDMLRTMTYAHLLVEFEKTTDGWRIAALVATDPSVEGPRGLRVGDSMDAVFARFGIDADDDAAVYETKDETGAFALSCIFFDDVLTEYVVYRI